MGERSGFTKVVVGGVGGGVNSKVGLELEWSSREPRVGNMVSGECKKPLETFPESTSESP